jgi:hypothetical protein
MGRKAKRRSSVIARVPAVKPTSKTVEEDRVNGFDPDRDIDALKSAKPEVMRRGTLLPRPDGANPLPSYETIGP